MKKQKGLEFGTVRDLKYNLITENPIIKHGGGNVMACIAGTGSVVFIDDVSY